MIGGITVESQPAASRTSNSTAVGPPTTAPGSTSVGGFADRFDQVEGLGRVRVRFEGRLDQDSGERRRRPVGDRVDAVDAWTADLRTRARRRRRDDDVGQRGGPGGKLLSSRCWPSTDSTSVAIAVFAGQVGREEGEAGAEDQQHGDRAERDPAWRPTATRLPTRAQTPWVASAACSSGAGAASNGVKKLDRAARRSARGPSEAARRSEVTSSGEGVEQDQRRRAGSTAGRRAGPGPRPRRRALDDRAAGRVGGRGGLRRVGTKGQKARRPKIVSSAGSRVSIESAAQATPIAAIGPRPGCR